MILKVPVFIKVILIPIFLIIGIPLLIVLISLGIMIEFIREYFLYTNQCCINFSRRFFCHDRNDCLSLTFIILPLWLLLISILVAITTVILGIIIIPAYILGFVSCIKMSIWWCRNRRIDEQIK